MSWREGETLLVLRLCVPKAPLINVMADKIISLTLTHNIYILIRNLHYEICDILHTVSVRSDEMSAAKTIGMGLVEGCCWFESLQSMQPWKVCQHAKWIIQSSCLISMCECQCKLYYKQTSRAWTCVSLIKNSRVKRFLGTINVLYYGYIVYVLLAIIGVNYDWARSTEVFFIDKSFVLNMHMCN